MNKIKEFILIIRTFFNMMFKRNKEKMGCTFIVPINQKGLDEMMNDVSLGVTENMIEFTITRKQTDLLFETVCLLIC